jgi:anti-sigma regulatory factor (Ser/Thr protein kinase)
MAEYLQRGLLPSDLPDHSAVDVAYRYLPSQAGAGQDWFDVIPLSGARVALVVGDVVGHGLHASATMGRLRTAVHNFSALDLAPDELLAHVDALVSRLNQETDTPGDSRVTGATCLYAIYDPATRICTIANAGHPPLALVHSNGSVSLQSPTPAPLLGAGGHPFALLELEVPEGSQLVLYTNGLLDNHEHDWEKGTARLSQALAARPGCSPEETCDAALGVLPTRTTDDVALLVARTKALDDQQVAVWDVDADPAIVADIRAAVVDKLTQWGLEEAAFATELIISELLSNAIRYGGGPIHVRLLQDRTLICEVSDASSTSPHLRRAAITDENGRGLFLVAQLTERWGTRYTARGKTIWAEQHLPT